MTQTATEKALRGMAKREWLSTLRLMGICEEPRTKRKRAVIIRPDCGRAEDAVMMLRGNGIIVLYERYATPDRFTILTADLGKADKLLSSVRIGYQEVPKEENE